MLGMRYDTKTLQRRWKLLSGLATALVVFAAEVSLSA